VAWDGGLSADWFEGRGTEAVGEAEAEMGELL